MYEFTTSINSNTVERFDMEIESKAFLWRETFTVNLKNGVEQPLVLRPSSYMNSRFLGSASDSRLVEQCWTILKVGQNSAAILSK